MNGTLDLGALGSGHRDAMVFQVKNRQVDLHLRSEGLEWMGGLAELFKMSINLREHLRVTSLQLQIMIFSCLFFSTNLSKTKSQSILQI